MSTRAWQDDAIREALRLYFIMGSNNCLPGVDPVQVLSEAIRGGVSLFQFREKGSGALVGDARVELAWRLRELCREHRIPFIVNDDVELALEVDADGVHVGQEDEAASTVRRLIGDAKLLGVSAYDEREAETAIRCGADYLGIGPLFSTRTKEDAKDASGLDVLTQMRELGMRIPIVGIGGITDGNAAEVIRAGADGISLISAISLAQDPFAASNRLRQVVDAAFAGMD
ncbi:thiamine phosphate synthase [Paenibacillus lignilyticus]|uniref:Thiamine-phosphate synthase n=1 Tax=Paenibacillus lignilyticus TaxID=1172615 RepID=A0ABS5CJK1_9BACL|nr:thiamine phosphate synthase [Paenibacillus lignilyticus]MBP3966062.1 thiamine phosphate synthase [Paenibacillus lignilyticus]